LTTAGAAVAGPGVSASKLGTTTRGDGSTQVTYNGHPLYYYVADTAPGQTTGQAISQFGAEWDVLSPAGSKVENGN
jgi:predicted lipoprotein with Yx(FWY)xxD motif